MPAVRATVHADLRNLEGLLERLERFLRALFRELERLVLRELQQATPVVTGRLRASWRLSYTNGNFDLTNSAPYAPFVQYRRPSVDGTRDNRALAETLVRKHFPAALRAALRSL